MAAAFVCTLVSAQPVLSQPYAIPVANSAPDIAGIDPTIAVFQGTTKWGDYNKDGFIDFLLTGRTVENNLGFEPLVGAIFRGNPPTNTTAAISYTQFSIIQPTWLSDAEWGDYDNDGDLDLVLIGSNTVENPLSGVAELYRNEGVGSGIPSFTSFDLPVPGLYSGSAEWGDYDNDGDLDILLSGVSSPGAHHTELLNNNNGVFTSVANNFAEIGFGDARFADVDNDFDLDVVLVGALSNNVSVSAVYRNDGGDSFVELPTQIEPTLFGNVDFADYDEDGDIDILVAGGKLGSLVMEGSTTVYNNDGSGVFSAANLDLVSLYYGEAGFVDYDTDGDVDIFTTGSQHPFTRGTTVMNASENDGASFVRTNLLTSGLGAAPFPGTKMGTMSFGDYDNDADLDIFLTGVVDDVIFMAIYGNLGAFNTRPREPEDLQTTVNGNEVDFSWTGPVDGQTETLSLSYALRIGSQPGGGDIVSPASSFGTGRVLIPKLGQITTPGWKIFNLNSGTYYWSVQAIDAGFVGSLFAPEQQFVIP